MTDQPDHIILQIALSDKKRAFDLAFHQHWQAIFTRAYRKVQSDQLAKDLSQDVFLVFWKNIEELAGQSAILPYLYAVLRNKIFQQYAKDGVCLRHILSLPSQEWTADTDVEQWLQHKQLQAIASEEIKNMPPRMKQIYRLKREENLSIGKIATQLGLSEQTVKNQLQSAYGRLRTRLENYRLPALLVGIALSQ